MIVTEYETRAVIISGRALTALERLDNIVNEDIKRGFQPFGGVSVSGTIVAQTLVKYGEINEEL